MNRPIDSSSRCRPPTPRAQLKRTNTKRQRRVFPTGTFFIRARFLTARDLSAGLSYPRPLAGTTTGPDEQNRWIDRNADGRSILGRSLNNSCAQNSLAYLAPSLSNRTSRSINLVITARGPPGAAARTGGACRRTRRTAWLPPLRPRNTCHSALTSDRPRPRACGGPPRIASYADFANAHRPAGPRRKPEASKHVSGLIAGSAARTELCAAVSRRFDSARQSRHSEPLCSLPEPWPKMWPGWRAVRSRSSRWGPRGASKKRLALRTLAEITNAARCQWCSATCDADRWPPR